MIPQETIQQILDKADIVDVISKYISISKKGKNYVAVCPFHDDHDPSMSISQDRQIFKCFVCGTGGNAIQFVQQYEKCSYVEAISKLADMVGVALPQSSTTSTKLIDPKKQKAYDALKQMQEFTNFELLQTSNLTIQNYIKQRNLTPAVIEHFGIGYNPDGNVVTKFLMQKGFKEEDLVSANISYHYNNDELVDVFKDRLTFPIDDYQGRIIGYTARALNPNAQSKYINTSETRVFKKGELVYNSSRARSSARKLNCIYVCEGVMDVIAFYKAGIENVVCTLGTSCTQQQLNIIKNLSNQVVFAYDGDKAGQNAIYKAGKMALSLGMNVKVFYNPTQLDPDEIYLQKGKEALVELTNKSLVWLEFVYDYLKKQFDLSTYNGKKDFANAIFQEIKVHADQFDRQIFLKRLYEDTGFDAQSQPQPQKQEQANISKVSKEPSANVLPQTILNTRLLRIQASILAQMLSNLNAQALYKEKLDFLPDKDMFRCASLLLQMCSNGTLISLFDLINLCDNQRQKDLLNQIAFDESLSSSYNPNAFLQACSQLEIELAREKITKYRKDLINEFDPSRRKEIEKQISDLYRYVKAHKGGVRD